MHRASMGPGRMGSAERGGDGWFACGARVGRAATQPAAYKARSLTGRDAVEQVVQLVLPGSGGEEDSCRVGGMRQAWAGLGRRAVPRSRALQGTDGCQPGPSPAAPAAALPAPRSPPCWRSYR